MKQRILIWDLPTRLFHWSLVLSFCGAFLTAESERYRDIHVVLGYILLGLIAFRLLWGLVGSRYARFESFVFGWLRVKRYLQSLLTAQPEHHLGHNPAGGWAIVGLLGLGLLAATSGVLLFEEVGGEEAFEELHELAANLMLLLVFVHVAGVLVSSLLHRENLLRAMIDGHKAGESQEGITASRTWLAALLAATIGGLLVYGQAAASNEPASPAQTLTQDED